MGDSPAPGRVLVVGDDPGLCRVIEINLAARGYRVDVALPQAVEVSLAGCVPDLVIADLGVAAADEMDTLAAVRRRFGSVALLVVSARGWEEVRRAALAAGADAFLPKPFPADALLGEVAAVLADRALRPLP